MNNNLTMEFSINKDNNAINIKREFAASLTKVWDAYTKSEILDLWWAPKPWQTKTKSMDFREGGRWFYAMCGPEGEEHWCIADYIKIQKQKSFTATDGFADADGKVNNEMPQSKWKVEFKDLTKNKCLVTSEITFGSLEQLETTIQMGFKEGITMAMEGLDEYLLTMRSKSEMEFSLDKENKTVTIKREFDAGLSLVWNAFTKQEILDQWWAPKPFESRTKIMNFEVGGRRFYAMVFPDGGERWSIQKYTSISPKTNFKMSSNFSDSAENPELPGSDWDFNFNEQNGKTKVTITIYNESRERMEKMIEMGFKEGITATLDELEVLLTKLSQ